MTAEAYRKFTEKINPLIAYNVLKNIGVVKCLGLTIRLALLYRKVRSAKTLDEKRKYIKFRRRFYALVKYSYYETGLFARGVIEISKPN